MRCHFTHTTRLQAEPCDVSSSWRCRWVLQADAEAGLDMFVQLRPPLAPATVLPVLRGVSATLCAPYLEAALAAHVASRETYETELAVMYLQALLEGGSRPDGEGVCVSHGTRWGETKSAEGSLHILGMRTTVRGLLKLDVAS